MSDIAHAKGLARARAKVLRAACKPAMGEALAAQVLTHCPPPAGAVVAGFWPIGDEIDIRFLLNALAARGYEIGLPETPPRGAALVFRRWTPGAALLPGRFGTQHPDGAPVSPDFVLVPLLAFDVVGNRLGYGGGYYDRTLAMLPNAFRLGCAYAVQEFPKLPTEPTDLKLHAVATERSLRRF